MLVECTKCGAPLEVKGSQRLVKCGYCNNTNRVRRMQTLSVSTPEGWAPPPQWTPPRQMSAASGRALAYQVRTSHRATNAAGSRGCLVAAIITVSMGFFTCIPFGGALLDGGSCNFGGGAIEVPGMPGSQPAMPAPAVFAQLAPSQPPSLGLLDLSATAEPLTVTGAIAPQVNLALLGQMDCMGYAPAQPHAVVRLGTMSQLTIAVTGAGPFTLVVREPTAALRCSRLADSRLDVLLPPGDHPLWVAVPSPMGQGTFALTVSAVATGGTPAGILGGIVVDAPPTLGVVDLAERRSPRSFEGQIRGAVEADDIYPGCRGYLSAAPQATIRLAEPTDLTVGATSGEDLTLLVRLHDGTILCDDDSGHGTNPRIQSHFQPGDHAVWVGTYHESTTAQVTLRVTR